ncbi:Retrovirus-related Pol polyprotein from transposon 297 [Anthophora plagiata]
MENTTAPQPSMEDLVRRVLECIGSNAAQISPPPSIGAIPEFSGEDIGEDATLWCNRVEEITKDVPRQRLNLATHVLTGPAKEWYRRWEAHPCTWEQFREDLCAVFVSERKLHDRLTRALQYTSDPATSYVEYARTKLTYLRQTQVSFTTAQQIELTVSTISDANVRQAMLNGRYETTADLMVGIAEYKKTTVLKRANYDDKAHGSSYKRCYTCDESGHIARMCPKKPRTDRRTSPSRSPPRRIITCTYCSKRGHEEANCWAKERAARKNQSNVCFSMDHKLTPIILRDTLVRESLIDSGATCSLVKEEVAKRANCAINPFVTTVRGLSDSSATTVGSTTTVIQAEGLSVELDLFVVPDSAIPYDLIIGKNVLAAGGIKIVTDEDGSTKLQRVPTAQNGTEGIEALCYATDGVDEKTRKAVAELLNRYSHMTATGSKVRRVSTGEMKIVTREERVVSYHPYRLSIFEREKVRGIIEELIENEIIRESTSPYASPIILVKKKNGEDRMCVDFRALNKITVKDRYPLPLIEDQIDRLGSGKYFTTLDMASGFYQIPIAEDSIEKTAFVTPDGHYEFRRMPFGLCNAPAVFQRAINKALGNLRNSIALVYLDDILIPSETIEEGFERLKVVLSALDKAGFSLNLKKCAFFKTKIEYLGREISAEGIRPGEAKIKSLLEAPIPENVKQVRQFMGLASYFRKFIPEFAVRTACITKLTKKDEQWRWGDEQEEARKYILKKLCTKPLLVIFDPTRETELHTDASSLGYGAILFQRVDGPKQGFLHSIPKKCIPFDTIHCDCVGPFEITKEGYQHILLIVDAFTKYLQLIPLKTLSGPEMLAIFRERLTLFGTPRVVVFDRGTNFTYKPLKLFIEKHGSQVHFIATGAPRANGQAERYVATVTNLLSIETKKGTEWPNKLAKLMLSLNTTLQKSTGFSPSRLLFGLETGPGNVMRAEEHLPANDRIDVAHDRSVAGKRLEENAVSQEARFNRMRINNIEYKEGDAIFLKPAGNRKAKLDVKYTGPFTISKILPNDRYEIIGKSGRPQIAPKDRLRAWKGEWEGDFESSDDTESTDEPC